MLNTNSKALKGLLNNLNLEGDKLSEALMQDFEKLQERNKKEVDKLLDLMKNNPEEALRFAIPLDEHGYMRGKSMSQFKMQDRGIDFSLFGSLNLGGSGGGGVDLGEEYFRIRKQYESSAQELRDRGSMKKLPSSISNCSRTIEELETRLEKARSMTKPL